MNLDEITDLNILKSLAYDQLQQIELYQNNLRNVQARIQQLNSEPPKEPEPTPESLPKQTNPDKKQDKS